MQCLLQYVPIIQNYKSADYFSIPTLLPFSIRRIIFALVAGLGLGPKEVISGRV